MAEIILVVIFIIVVWVLFFSVARVLGASYDKKPLKYTETEKVESNIGNRIDKTIAKNINVGLIVLFWIIVLGFLGGLELIKDVFFAGAVWIYVIIQQGIILLLIATPIYLIYKLLNHKNKSIK